jgi:ribosomal protein S18 acetylase RimI-like enzyme
MIVTICQSTDWILTNEAFIIYRQCMGTPTYENYQAKMKRILENAQEKIYTCSMNDRYVGIITLLIIEMVMEITGISVLSDCKHMGIGSYMLEQVIEKEKIHYIFAETDEDAVGFYIKNGFSINKKIKQYPNGDCIRYECKLNI